MVLTPHEEENCFTVSSILRNLPQLPEFVVAWDFPLTRLAKELNPDALRRPQAKNKVMTDREFIEQLLTDEPASTAAICQKAAQIDVSRRTVERFLQRLKDGGLICSDYGLYWRKPA